MKKNSYFSWLELMHLNLRGADIHWQEQQNYKLSIISECELCLSSFKLVSMKLKTYNSHNTFQICTPKTIKWVLSYNKIFVLYYFDIVSLTTKLLHSKISKLCNHLDTSLLVNIRIPKMVWCFLLHFRILNHKSIKNTNFNPGFGFFCERFLLGEVLCANAQSTIFPGTASHSIMP